MKRNSGKSDEPKSPHVSTLLVRKLHDLRQSILDGTATVPGLLDGLQESEKMADSLDHRRTALDPSLGGKVR